MYTVRYFQFVAILILGFSVSHSAGAVLNLGDVCNSEIDTCAEENAECISMETTEMCGCLRGYVPNQDNSKCLKTRETIGGVCEESVQCKVEHTSCLPDGEIKYCLCEPGRYVIEQPFTKCYPVVGLIENGICEITKQCPSNAECKTFGDDKKCGCIEGYVKSFRSTSCLERATEIDFPCTEQVQCTDINGYCFATSGQPTCICPSTTTVPNKDSTYCNQKARYLYDPCSENNQCADVSSSYCNRAVGQCRCPSTHVASLDLTACLTKTNIIGDLCEETVQCEVEGTACVGEGNDKFCDCATNFVPDVVTLDKCYPVISTIENEICEQSNQCPENAECKVVGDGKRCSCISGYVKNLQGTLCLETSEIGGDCTENQCPDGNSVCVDGKCECKEGFVESSDKKSCLKKAEKINDECQERAQCSHITAAICNTVANQCRCLSTHVPSLDLSTCLQKIGGLNVPCEQTNQCTTANAECVDELCTCKDDYVQGGNFCLEKIDTLGEGCIIDAQCLPSNSTCLTEEKPSVCGCEPEFISSVNNKTCLPLAENINDECQERTQCSQITFAICNTVANQCRCLSTHVPSTDLSRCLRKVSGLNVACEVSAQCSTANAECVDELCTCKESHVQGGNFCLEKVNTLGENCVIDAQCTPENSACITESESRVCGCVPDFVSSENKKACLPLVNHAEPCSDPAQCGLISGNVTCSSEGICACEEGNVFDQAGCWQIKSLDETCSRPVQCRLAENNDRVGCIAGRCQCKESFKPDVIKNICNSGVQISAAVTSLLLALALIFDSR